MKISVYAPFFKYQDGIPRAAEELISKLCEADDVESVSVIVARRDREYVSPFLLQSEKVSLFVVRSFLLPWTLLRAIKLYKTSDVLLLFTYPCYFFDPSSLLFSFQLLVKFRILPGTKWVQMLYDFVFYTCPEDMRAFKENMLFKVWKKYFVHVPVRYVAISESTKKEAMSYWGPRTAEITVIHLASFMTPKSPRTHFGSKKILTVSSISPRKNQLRLIEAFELVHRNNPSSGAELMIVGRKRKDIPGLDSTLRDIRKRNNGIKITLAGYLTDSEIMSLYEEADIFVYPSLYEGFGLPVLEAMACGCPIVASNVFSLPEVVGEAGMLVDPYDVDMIARALSAVLENDELKREMSRKGIEQAQKFSWERAGVELLAVCREVAEKRSQRE
ncbi:MAG: glycosyltransferase family 4 protein [Parachlamydiaceae bacterium]